MKREQICYTIWLNFRICTPCWNFVPGICHGCWPCPDWPSLVHPMAVDGVEGDRDGWSSQWISLPLEPIKFPATVWRVSKLESANVLHLWQGSCICSFNRLCLSELWIFSHEQLWLPWLPSSCALHQVRELRLYICLHGLVSIDVWHCYVEYASS